MADNKKVGIITEQAYPAGQFGFSPVKKDDQKNIDKTDKKKETEKK